MKKHLSVLDAAEIVLKNARQPMTPLEIWEVIALMGLWRSLAGRTPWDTLGAALYRELIMKGANARFEKFVRGKFVRR